MHLLVRTKPVPDRPGVIDTELYLYLLGTSGHVSTLLEVHILFQGATALSSLCGS